MQVPPQFTRVAPELSGIGTKLVNDAADAKQVAAGTQWLYNWLRRQWRVRRKWFCRPEFIPRN